MLVADDAITRPDGVAEDMRFVFCGEHASQIHGWIQVLMMTEKLDMSIHDVMQYMSYWTFLQRVR